MSRDFGKKFETKFKEDFSKLPQSSVIRIYDTQGGMLGVRNICDFICYVYPNIFLIECKSIKGNTFPLSNLTQYDRLLPFCGIKGMRVGVVIWFYEHDKVVYVPIKTIETLKQTDNKSFNVKDIINYNVVEIPSIKRRVFMDSDYSILCNLEEGM